MANSTEPSGESVDRPFVHVVWQQGLPNEVGINGCQVDDVLSVALEKLRGYQAGPLSCEENAEAMDAIEKARTALESRRRRRTEQGVLNTMTVHKSERTEDLDSDFSATGS